MCMRHGVHMNMRLIKTKHKVCTVFMPILIKWAYYSIYPAIKLGFCPSRMTSNN